jgi:RNA polymerase sigma-70 factor, ECF subfamily
MDTPVSAAGEITRLLGAAKRGDADAESQLIAIVHQELNQLAHRFMRKERPDHTLQTTALVNEAYLRLMGPDGKTWTDRAHFFATAAIVMRRILVDYARQHVAAKRSGGKQRVEIGEFMAAAASHTEDMLILDEALTRLAARSARQARLVEMMYFGGLTEEEAAGVLGISARTAKRDWCSARAWLHVQLSRKPV